MHLVPHKISFIINNIKFCLLLGAFLFSHRLVYDGMEVAVAIAQLNDVFLKYIRIDGLFISLNENKMEKLMKNIKRNIS